MKRVACLSTIESLSKDASSSFEVIDIFNSTRICNVEHQVTGSFIVYNQVLLMIIEGESTQLGNIIFKCRQDERLKDFSIILNVNIQKPEFSSWGIKLLRQDGEGQERFYDKLNTILNDKVELKSALDKQRLEKFLNSDSKENNNAVLPRLFQPKPDTNKPSAQKQEVSGQLDFSNSMISLSAWPKPGRIKLSPELIKICARLVGRPHRFEDLIKENFIESKQALLAYLYELNKLGILKKHSVDEKPPLVGIPGGLNSDHKKTSTDRFSAVLRNFLSASRQ